MAFLTDTGIRTGGISGRIAAFRAHLAERAERRRIFNQTYSELSQLSDRELGDIGLSRSDISRVAREASRL